MGGWGVSWSRGGFAGGYRCYSSIVNPCLYARKPPAIVHISEGPCLKECVRQHTLGRSHPAASCPQNRIGPRLQSGGGRAAWTHQPPQPRLHRT